MEQIEKFASANPARRPAIEQAGDRAHQTIDQLSAATQPVVSRAVSGAHRLVDRVAGTTTRVAQQLQETGTRLKNAEQRMVGASTGYVRDHPLRSLGIALVAGFVVSQLTTTSHHSTDSGK